LDVERGEPAEGRSGGAEDQPTNWGQRGQQPSPHLLNGLAIEIDENIATQYEVHVPNPIQDRRVRRFGQVEVAEGDRFPEGLVEPIAPVARAEVALDRGFVEAAQRPAAVRRFASLGERGAGNVGTQNIDL